MLSFYIFTCRHLSPFIIMVDIDFLTRWLNVPDGTQYIWRVWLDPGDTRMHGCLSPSLRGSIVALFIIILSSGVTSESGFVIAVTSSTLLWQAKRCPFYGKKGGVYCRTTSRLRAADDIPPLILSGESNQGSFPIKIPRSSYRCWKRWTMSPDDLFEAFISVEDPTLYEYFTDPVDNCKTRLWLHDRHTIICGKNTKNKR